MKRLWPVLALLAGCDALPRDTDGTHARVEKAHVVRVGLAAGTRMNRPVSSLIAGIEHAAGARATTVTGAGEPLLLALDDGRLDVVVGAFAEDTPWRDRVSLAPPVARHMDGGKPLLIRAAVRNGENRWAMLVEHASREAARR